MTEEKERPTMSETVLKGEVGDETMPHRKPTAESAGTASLAMTEMMTTEQPHQDNEEQLQESSVWEIPWNKRLASPTIAAFSPSLLDKNRHGLGLLTVCNRARQLTRYGRRSVAVILEAAALYEVYGQALLKAAQTLQTASFSNSALVSSLQDAVGRWSQETMQLSTTSRTMIGQVLQDFYGTHGDVVQAIVQKYDQCRQSCQQLRQKALAAKTKYVRAFQETEASLQDNEEEKKMDPGNSVMDMEVEVPSSSPSKRPISGRTNSKLQSLMVAEAAYVLSCRSENERVAQCQKLESMALETMQMLEEDRMLVFAQMLTKLLTAQQHAVEKAHFLQEVKEEAKADSLKEDDGPAVRKRPVSPFPRLAKDPSRDAEDASLVSEVDLPLEVAHLREQVRVKGASRINRLQMYRVLAAFLDAVAGSAAKFGSGLKHLLDRESSQYCKGDGLIEGLKPYHAPEIIELLETFTNLLAIEAEGSLSLSTSLRSMRAEKIEKALLSAEKSIKASVESEDLLWKQLNDAIKMQAKAVARLHQASAQCAKIKVSIKSDVEAESGEDSKVNNQVTKGIANVFSLLPDGGEKALKMLGPGTRATIAQQSLQDSETKEAKANQALVEAVENTTRATVAYKAKADALLSAFDGDATESRRTIRFTVETFLSEAYAINSALCDRLRASKVFQNHSISSTDTWLAQLEAKVVAECSDPSVKGNSESGFMLRAVPLYSDKVAAMRGQDDSFDLDEATDIVSMDERRAATVLEDDDVASRSSDTSATKHKKPSSFQKLTKSPKGLGQKLSMSLSRRSSLTTEEPMLSADTETDLFLEYFWSEEIDKATVPPVVSSFACSYRSQAHRVPYQYGRLFLSSTRLIFNSWTGKKLNLPWSDVLDVDAMQSDITSRDDALMVTPKTSTCATTSEVTYSLLGSISDRASACEVISQLRQEATARDHEAHSPQALNEVASDNIATVSDPTLQKMKVVLRRQLRNTPIRRFYDIVWAEGEGTDYKPLYGPWLTKKCFDIEVGKWHKVDAVGPWCGETYQQTRVVKFRVKRKTHLYIGPPIADATQTHYCRLEGDDKCVLGMRVEFEGIPYSDTFAVEVRWVARRQGSSDLLVEVGVFVDFKKSTFLASKIKSGTTEETTPIHTDLFETVRAACMQANGGIDLDDLTEPEVVSEIESQKPIGFSLMGLIASDKVKLFAGVVVLVAVFLVWRSISRGATMSPESEILLLKKRVLLLEGELKDMHVTVKKLLAAVKQDGAH